LPITGARSTAIVKTQTYTSATTKVFFRVGLTLARGIFVLLRERVGAWQLSKSFACALHAKYLATAVATKTE